MFEGELVYDREGPFHRPVIFRDRKDEDISRVNADGDVWLVDCEDCRVSFVSAGGQIRLFGCEGTTVDRGTCFVNQGE